MKITDIRVRKVTKQGKMRAVVSVTFDNEFVVHDIKVIEGEDSLLQCPARNQLMESIVTSRIPSTQT